MHRFFNRRRIFFLWFNSFRITHWYRTSVYQWVIRNKCCTSNWYSDYFLGIFLRTSFVIWGCKPNPAKSLDSQCGAFERLSSMQTSSVWTSWNSITPCGRFETHFWECRRMHQCWCKRRFSRVLLKNDHLREEKTQVKDSAGLGVQPISLYTTFFLVSYQQLASTHFSHSIFAHSI